MDDGDFINGSSLQRQLEVNIINLKLLTELPMVIQSISEIRVIKNTTSMNFDWIVEIYQLNYHHFVLIPCSRGVGVEVVVWCGVTVHTTVSCTQSVLADRFISRRDETAEMVVLLESNSSLKILFIQKFVDLKMLRLVHFQLFRFRQFLHNFIIPEN